MDVLDGSTFAFEFLGAEKVFESALAAAFPDEDVVTRSSFSGAEVVALVASLGKATIGKLAAFLVQAKKTEAARSIKIKVGRDREVSLTGFGGDEVKQMEDQLLLLIRELKGPYEPRARNS
jgi:hypothetical protein